MSIDPTLMVKRFKRGSSERVGRYYQAREFDCHCRKCPTTLIAPVLVDMLDSLREIAGAPVTILSGYRCKARQDQLRAMGLETAKGPSSHEYGLAADVQIRGKSGAEIRSLAEHVGFERIGQAATWCHVDIKAGQAFWVYGGTQIALVNAGSGSA